MRIKAVNWISSGIRVFVPAPRICRAAAGLIWIRRQKPPERTGVIPILRVIQPRSPIAIVGAELVPIPRSYLLLLAIGEISRPTGTVRPQPVRHHRHSPRHDRPRPEVQVR